MSTATESGECAICAAPTSKLCGRCERVFFCSADHQKLLWPSHKWLCGKDLSTFSFPPLNAVETETIQRLYRLYRSGTLHKDFSSLFESMDKDIEENASGGKANVEVGVWLLGQPEALDDHLLPRIYHCLARSWIHRLTDGLPAPTHWHFSGNFYCAVGHSLENLLSAEEKARFNAELSDEDVRTLLAPLLRAHLAFVAVSAPFYGDTALERPAWKRVEETAAQLDVDERLKAAVEKAMELMRERMTQK
ncbi:hypothetical protein JCM6882_003127 [Rhodosporidiobolus microsporus]